MTSSYSKKRWYFFICDDKREIIQRIISANFILWLYVNLYGKYIDAKPQWLCDGFRWKNASGSVINTPEFMKNLQHEPFSAELNVDGARENVMFKVINNRNFSGWKIKAKLSTTSEFCMTHIRTRFMFELSFKMCVKWYVHCTWRLVLIHVIFV